MDPELNHAEALVHPQAEALVTDRAFRLRELVPDAVTTIGTGILILVPLSGWGIGRMVVTAAILVGYLLLWNVLQFWLITFAATVSLTALYGGGGWKPESEEPGSRSVFVHLGLTLL